MRWKVELYFGFSFKSKPESEVLDQISCAICYLSFKRSSVFLVRGYMLWKLSSPGLSFGVGLSRSHQLSAVCSPERCKNMFSKRRWATVLQRSLTFNQHQTSDLSGSWVWLQSLFGSTPATLHHFKFSLSLCPPTSVSSVAAQTKAHTQYAPQAALPSQVLLQLNKGEKQSMFHICAARSLATQSK